MARSSNSLILALAFVMAACGPPKSSGESDPLEYLEESCELFCARAVGCSQRFVETLEFTTTTECEAACVDYTEDFVDLYDRPDCRELLGDMWQCGGMIEECSVFQAFEDRAYEVPPLEEHGCLEEIVAADGCT